MNMKDTIVAIATAPGQGGIGVVRLSGADAERILEQVFHPAGGGFPLADHLLTYGWLMDGEERLDECMAVVMRTPRSYTRETVVELQTHGGSYVLDRCVACCCQGGARLAEAGEFTRRAFLNGRIDLSRAEAVMRMISARGAQEHRAAVRQLEGGAASFVREAADRLYALQAGLAAAMDYPEEISDEEGTEQLRPGLEALITFLREAMDERSARLVNEGLRVALIGRPNVGKSSLLNALMEEERAIVTDIPGTTRDLVEGELWLGGVQVRLTDTAGLRETNDPVERIGVERSQKALREADLALLVLDASGELTAEDQMLLGNFPASGIVLLNKADLPRRMDSEELRRQHPGVRQMSVSAKNPASLQPLKDALREAAAVSDRMVLTQPRHLDALRRATRHLEDALMTLEQYTPDMAATDLQAAQQALGEITGDQVDEKLLDAVFSTFCVGK